jgi:molybdate transport system ATP-binding protein
VKPLLLEVSNLCVAAGKFKLQNIRFEMDREDYLIILGPTGCGKTMLLETLAGLHKPISGQLRLEDRDISLMPPESRGIGFAYQDSLLYPFLTVRENILFGSKAQKMDKDSRTLRRLDRLTETMGITHLLQRSPRFLSGGEKQRVSLARAILTQPSLLLLDEPLSALDPPKRYAMRELLKEIHRLEGLGIIHVTHDYNEARQLGSKVLIMNAGEIVQQGKALEVFENPDSLFVSTFLQNENMVEGSIHSIDDALWFKAKQGEWCLGPLERDTASGFVGNAVYLMFQANQMGIAPIDTNKASAPFSWHACVDQVTFHSTHVGLVCKGNGSWHVALSRKEWHQLGLVDGAEVTLSVDSQIVHLMTTA